MLAMADASDFPSMPSRPKAPPPPPGRGSKIPRGPAFLLGAAAVIALIIVVAVATGRAGIVEVDAKEVAVIVNYVTGGRTVVNRPGYTMFLPLLGQAFTFDKAPQKFLMEGERDLDANHVAKLTVRAKDGSNFWFETLEIQYEIIPEQASVVLQDSVPGEVFKENWVRAYARSILRDEFGQFSSEEVADPSNYSLATQHATERLNALLNPHGIQVRQIITPKPKFEDRYEQTIEKRKVADQTVQKLRTRALQLERERERRLADIERDRATEYEMLLGQLEEKRISAEKDAVRASFDADAYKIGELAAGQADEERQIQQARGLAEMARKEAEGLRAKVEAVALRGDVLVREALAKKFATIVFEIVPYRRDPAPIRIEHLGGASAPGSGAPR
jgi:hypothetical protein